MYWYDGQLCESEAIALPISDPGLLYGATVFTTLRVWQESLEHPLSFWREHCDRLRHSLQAFGWSEPHWDQLSQGAETLTQNYPVLRITIFPDGREWITGRSLPTNLQKWQQEGISAWVAPGELRRSLPSHKTGNYLACWLAGQQARSYGHQEAILINRQGHWIETSTGNLWGWSDGCWWTPCLATPEAHLARTAGQPITGGQCGEILPGVGRSHLIRVLKWHNKEVQEAVWTLDRVIRFETLLYTNSVRHVVPIARVNQDAVVGVSQWEDKYEKGQPLTYCANHPQLRELVALFNTVV